MDETFQQSPTGHESRDADIRPIILTAIGLALSVVVVGLIVYGVFQYLAAHPATSVQSSPMTVLDSQIPPAPRIEEHPAIQIQQLRSQEDRALTTYGWVNKKAGVVRIPIDRAMELQLERGFPTRKEPKK